jgi:hypothetical protein
MTLLEVVICIDENIRLSSMLKPPNDARSKVKIAVSMQDTINKFYVNAGMDYLSKRKWDGLRRRRNCSMTTHGKIHRSTGE